MGKQILGVGVVGLEPGRSWAAVAHLPALLAQPDDFRIEGIANSSLASSRRAAETSGIRRAFASVEELIAAPEVDIVAVTVKVPHHRAIVSAALAADKHVYCEWPLGNGLAETRELADMARGRNLHAVIGTQARAAPALLHVRDLLAQGYVGTPLSMTLSACGTAWGAETLKCNAYTNDDRNGATMLTIPIGHTLAAMTEMLGDVQSVSALLQNRRGTAKIIETGEIIPATSPDQIQIIGTFTDGTPLCIHYQGGMPRGVGLEWMISGTEGDIRISGAMGQTQMTALSVFGGRGETPTLEPIDIPAGPQEFEGMDDVPGNVARIYAQMAVDIRKGTRTAPDFDDAVATHRILEAIERSNREGRRVAIDEI